MNYKRKLKSVLIVDDEPLVRRSLARVLRGRAVVSEAESAEQALEALLQGLAVDIVLTDYSMPGGLSGADLADEIYRRFASGSPEVFLMSGSSRALDLMEAATTRGIRLIEKPFEAVELYRILGLDEEAA